MQDHTKAMVMASFAADSLALGVHWIYDTSLIDQKFGRVETLHPPQPDSYHSTKTRGEFTHYGDQTLLLLKTVAADKAFDLEQFAQSWQAYFKTYDGYIDHATRQTLENFSRGKTAREAGSSSTDLGGAARIAPLIYLYRRDYESLTSAVKAQTAMTHNSPPVVEAASLLATITCRVLDGTPPVKAIETAAKGSTLEAPTAKGLESVQADTRQTILKFGQMCDIETAWPGVVHLTAKYADNLKAALVENIMAGGDSAARGMVVGMILGAHLGSAAIPADWLADLKYRSEIDKHLDSLA